MKCIICNKEIEKSAYTHAVLCSSECFHKHYWKTSLLDHSRLIINHDLYSVGSEDDKPKGFGGRTFYIRMIKDNSLFSKDDIFAVNSLWHNGTIPDDMYDPSMDNAEFLREDEYRELLRMSERL